MKTEFKRLSIIFFMICCILFSRISAFSQAPENGMQTNYQPIRKVDLGVESLTLEVGETYTFAVNFEPENPPVTRMTWFNTDNTVVGLNQLTNTVTALTPGTAKVMAESFDKEAYAVCEITVSGTQEKDLSGMVEGKSLLTLSDEDRTKIRASQINRYLDLLEISVFNEEAFQKIRDQSMDVMAKVNPGTEEAESERALALGMAAAYPLKNLHMVSLHGSFIQILEFVKDNEDLIRIFKGHDIYIFDPLPETEDPDTQSKAAQSEPTTMLLGKVEELTSVSTIHKLGYTGKGTTIAIVDTGLNRDHEQFAGRVIAENCFSYSWHCKPIDDCEPCDPDDTDCDPYKCFDCDNNLISSCEGGSVENWGQVGSSFPGGAAKLNEFDHGSHVAGICAGKDGMAPKANIVMVQVQSEFYTPLKISEKNPDGYTVTLWNHDIYGAYDWLLGIQDDLKKEEMPISIINLSLGGGTYPDYCDESSVEEFSYLQKLNAAGIIPVVASGNEFHDDKVASPGCLSNAFTVGALATMDDPYIAVYSNHNRNMVDILAPGSQLWSSYLTDKEGNTGTDCYGYMSGTSMATPVVSGALALIREAYPGLGPEDYKSTLVELSTKTADRRNSNNRDEFNFTTDDGTGTVFDYSKPVLDFSNFQKPEPQTETLIIKEGLNEGITAVDNISINSNDPAIIVDMTDEKAEVIVSGDVKTQGENAVIVNAGSADGEFSLFVDGDVNAKGAAIVIDEESTGSIDILVTHLIKGNKAGILIKENAVELKNVGETELLSNVTITAFEIEPKDNVVEFVGNESASDLLERSINYIIRAEQPINGLIRIVDENNENWQQQSHGYDTANPGQKVYFNLTPLESETFNPEDWDFDVYNMKTGKKLDKENDLYVMEVPNGGPVHVYARLAPKPVPPKPHYDDFFDIFDMNKMPKTGFSAVRPQLLSMQPLNVQYKPTRLTLQLPELDMEADIVTVPNIDGEYPVEWLGGSVGMLEGSSLPGEGITILTGHNHLNTTEAGPFALLRELEAGDSIMITDHRGVMKTWHVYENAKIPADGFAKIAGDLKENSLVLITCEDELPEGGYLNRRVVFAKPAVK